MAITRLDIRLAIDPARARLWHRALADDLRRRGHTVSIVLKPGGPTPPAAMGLLLSLEGLAYARRPNAAGAPWTGAELKAAAAEPRDGAALEINLTGRVSSNAKMRTLAPVYGGALVEEAAFASLMTKAVPRIGVRDSAAPERPMMTHPGIDDVNRLAGSLDNLGARLAAILVRAVDMVAEGKTVTGSEPVALRDAHAWHGRDTMRALGYPAARLLNKLLRKPPHWYVGWRRTDTDRVYDTMAIPKGGWTRLPDDGKRFYADPFVIARNGRTWIFVEELPFATDRGIISVVELGRDGPIGTPRPVLERPGHLSYPFVFERDGQMWMIPESAGNRTVDLYRAEAFPDRWVHVATLLSNVAVGDATMVEHGGRFWMFGTVGGGDASSWDALHIWSADRLEGPWTPHGHNPVLMDALGARPGGAFYYKDGALWRPAQDCTTGYGAGLALCRVTKLDDDGFEQEIATVLRAGSPDWPGTGLHSLNWAAGVEVVDGCQDRK